MIGSLKNERGSNLVYVVILIVLMGMLGAAYSLTSAYNAKEAAQQRTYQEERYLAKSILRGVVDATTAGENPAAAVLTSKIDRDLEEYLAQTAQWGELPEEEQQGGDMPDFEDYVRGSYETSGTTRLDDCSVTVKTLCFAQEDGGRYLEISVQVSQGGRAYSLSARVDAQLGEPEAEGKPAPVEGWSVTKYYEDRKSVV